MSKETDKIAALEAEVKNLNEQIESKDSIIAEQNLAIEGLNSEISKLAAKKSIADVIVEHEGKKYRVTIPKFKFEKELHSADSLAEKPELVAKLVAEGFGGFEEVAE